VHVEVISNVVDEELGQASRDIREMIQEALQVGEFEIAAENEESRTLFEANVAANIVPARYRNDLRRVSVATVARADAPIL
jgi:hypothetical protein